MSHTIDYRSHGYARSWNGHWAIPMSLWKIVRGRRPYLINRLPHSAHISAMKELGFDIIRDINIHSAPIARKDLRAPFRAISDEDLTISGSFIQARASIARQP